VEQRLSTLEEVLILFLNKSEIGSLADASLVEAAAQDLINQSPRCEAILAYQTGLYRGRRDTGGSSNRTLPAAELEAKTKLAFTDLSRAFGDDPEVLAALRRGIDAGMQKSAQRRLIYEQSNPRSGCGS
jgi:hypothetical protein